MSRLISNSKLHELAKNWVGVFVDDLSVGQMARELLRAREALRYYADTDNWRPDDWGVAGVIGGKDYGHPGATARAALPKHLWP